LRHHRPFPTRRSSDLACGECSLRPDLCTNTAAKSVLRWPSKIAKQKKDLPRQHRNCRRRSFLLYSFGFVFRSVFILCLHEKQPRSEEHTSELQSRFDL